MTIRTIPVISAFCSPERGVRGLEVTLGCGLGVEYVVRLGVLAPVFARFEVAFLVVALLVRVVDARGFAVVLVFVAVGFLLVVRVAIEFSVIYPVLIIHLGEIVEAICRTGLDLTVTDRFGYLDGR